MTWPRGWQKIFYGAQPGLLRCGIGLGSSISLAGVGLLGARERRSLGTERHRAVIGAKVLSNCLRLFPPWLPHGPQHLADLALLAPD